MDLEENGKVQLSTTIRNYDSIQTHEIEIKNNPVMIEAVNVLEHLGKNPRVLLKAKGDHIPNAVAVANIITEKMSNGNFRIHDIKVDIEGKAGIGKMTSIIEIVLGKK